MRWRRFRRSRFQICFPNHWESFEILTGSVYQLHVSSSVCLVQRLTNFLNRPNSGDCSSTLDSVISYSDRSDPSSVLSTAASEGWTSTTQRQDYTNGMYSSRVPKASTTTGWFGSSSITPGDDPPGQFCNTTLTIFTWMFNCFSFSTTDPTFRNTSSSFIVRQVEQLETRADFLHTLDDDKWSKLWNQRNWMEC